MSVTRLAPSPTGSLHLGNLRTFLLTWLVARSRGWTLAMRIEDLDAQRVKPGAVEETLELLSWLGLDHDGAILRQSEDLEPYRWAMRRLAEQGLVYACALSRSELRRVLSAPHDSESEPRFPPELRPKRRAPAPPDSAAPMGDSAAPMDGSAAPFGARSTNEALPDRDSECAWGFRDPSMNHRYATPPGVIELVDVLAGHRRFEPAAEVGDFVVWTRQGVPAYQLAVVVDDHRQGVTEVIRGDDLLPSAARQTHLHRSLSQQVPRWWHVPLVLDAQGRRLAKREGSGSAAGYRAAGVPPERLLGLLGEWLGLLDSRRPCTLRELVGLLSERTPPGRSGTWSQAPGPSQDQAVHPTPGRSATLDSRGLRMVRFTQEDHEWLLTP